MAIFNVGAAPLLVSGIAILGNDFAIVSDGCTGVPVASGAACALAVAFAPTAAGPVLASLQLSSNAPGSPTLVTLAGTGTLALAGTLAAPDAQAFADQAIGSSSAPRVVPVTNTGTVPVMVSGVVLAGDFMQTNDCARLAAGGTCHVAVVFRPGATGLRTAMLTILSDASNPVLNVQLSGRGTHLAAPVLRLSATGLAFGNRMTGVAGSPQSVTLTNAGDADLAIVSYFIRGEFSQANDCPAVVGPGASCRIDVTFLPSVPGSRTGTFEVTSNAASGSASLDLAGRGCRLFSVRTSRIPTLSCD
jgi:hypothetical protein